MIHTREIHRTSIAKNNLPIGRIGIDINVYEPKILEGYILVTKNFIGLSTNQGCGRNGLEPLEKVKTLGDDIAKVKEGYVSILGESRLIHQCFNINIEERFVDPEYAYKNDVDRLQACQFSGNLVHVWNDDSHGFLFAKEDIDLGHEFDTCLNPLENTFHITDELIRFHEWNECNRQFVEITKEEIDFLFKVNESSGDERTKMIQDISKNKVNQSNIFAKLKHFASSKIPWANSSLFSKIGFEMVRCYEGYERTTEDWNNLREIIQENFYVLSSTEQAEWEEIMTKYLEKTAKV